ncbi:MAG: zinc ribbon domain-containing protein [Desulfovibrio sp.]|nr:zinc ribbon domain-containing protein [Desulfovibrio sp.]
MPIYEYQCPKCGNIFEEWAKASESHKEEPCPQCGTPSPRIISRTSFVLKGDGWYVSDYGYRKGITEDGGGGAAVPAPSTPTTPAKQGEKALATTEAKPAKAEAPAPKAEKAAKPAKAKAAANGAKKA